MKKLKKILAHYGPLIQKTKSMEELSELIQAIAKNIAGVDNRDNIVEEIADSMIMISQLMLIFDINEEEVDKVKEEKIDRTLERIDKDEKNSNRRTSQELGFSNT